MNVPPLGKGSPYWKSGSGRLTPLDVLPVLPHGFELIEPTAAVVVHFLL